jgi:hypothetical protein
MVLTVAWLRMLGTRRASPGPMHEKEAHHARDAAYRRGLIPTLPCWEANR